MFVFVSIVDVWDVHKPELKACGCEVFLEGIAALQDSSHTDYVITCTLDANLTSSPSQYRILIKQTGVSD